MILHNIVLQSAEFKMAENAAETNAELTQKLGNGKKSKKSVTWARDAVLEEVFYFEMDETERGGWF